MRSDIRELSSVKNSPVLCKKKQLRSTMRVRSTQALAEVQSDFDLSLMHRHKIVKRTLAQWSVHRSPTTLNWIATITRPDQQNPEKIRHIQFPFATEIEARTFCKSYAPPKLCQSRLCQICNEENPNPTVRNCRNCGVSVCDKCSVRWGARMVPKTYSSSVALTQRVCRSCDWLSNAFCMTLLKGRFADAKTLFQTVRTGTNPDLSEVSIPGNCIPTARVCTYIFLLFSL